MCATCPAVYREHVSPDSGDEAHVSRGGAVTSDRDYLFIIYRSGIEMDMAVVAADMRGEEGWWYYYIIIIVISQIRGISASE